MKKNFPSSYLQKFIQLEQEKKLLFFPLNDNRGWTNFYNLICLQINRPSQFNYKEKLYALSEFWLNPFFPSFCFSRIIEFQLFDYDFGLHCFSARRQCFGCSQCMPTFSNVIIIEIILIDDCQLWLGLMTEWLRASSFEFWPRKKSTLCTFQISEHEEMSDSCNVVSLLIAFKVHLQSCTL